MVFIPNSELKKELRPLEEREGLDDGQVIGKGVERRDTERIADRFDGHPPQGRQAEAMRNSEGVKKAAFAAIAEQVSMEIDEAFRRQSLHLIQARALATRRDARPVAGVDRLW